MVHPVMLLLRPNWILRLATPVRALGPYAAVELLIPGGSLIALSMLAFRHRAWLTASVRRLLTRLVALGADFIAPAELPQGCGMPTACPTLTSERVGQFRPCIQSAICATTCCSIP
jgi:hypothetical protein